jgi:tRNA pseudouridine32 synthase/23S rRNA pseudouridine746 synthase
VDSLHRGFLAAYSGLLGGRNDWQYFVPPVFDAQQPDGHFKRTEREISAINREISANSLQRMRTRISTT